jgi:hypothetical protein
MMLACSTNDASEGFTGFDRFRGFEAGLGLPQVYSLMVTPGQHANPLRRLWHELADRGEGLRSHWCAIAALQLQVVNVLFAGRAADTL